MKKYASKNAFVPKVEGTYKTDDKKSSALIQLVFDLQTSKVRIDESRSFLFEYNYILCFEEFEQDKICFSILNNSDQMFIVDL